jgi:hypothetical protein
MTHCVFGAAAQIRLLRVQISLQLLLNVRRRKGHPLQRLNMILLIRGQHVGEEGSRLPASTSLRIAGACSVMIQSSPPGLRTSSTRASVIMPRSLTSTTRQTAL